MNRAALLLICGCLAGAAHAAPPSADPGIYGAIDTTRFPKPELVNSKPVIADRARLPQGAKPAAAQLLYLHIPQRDISHWQAHCADYHACGVPVHFVTESWFVNVYLPAIGAFDGREQRYREQMGRDREVRRDFHEERGSD